MSFSVFVYFRIPSFLPLKVPSMSTKYPHPIDLSSSLSSLLWLAVCAHCSVMLQNSFWCRHYFQLNLNCHFNNSTNALNHLNSAAVTAGPWSCSQFVSSGMPAAGAILLWNSFRGKSSETYIMPTKS